MALPCSLLHRSSIVRQAIIRKLSSTPSKEIFLLRFPLSNRQQVIPRLESRQSSRGFLTGCDSGRCCECVMGMFRQLWPVYWCRVSALASLTAQVAYSEGVRHVQHRGT